MALLIISHAKEENTTLAKKNKLNKTWAFYRGVINEINFVLLHQI